MPSGVIAICPRSLAPPTGIVVTSTLLTRSTTPVISKPVTYRRVPFGVMAPISALTLTGIVLTTLWVAVSMTLTLLSSITKARAPSGLSLRSLGAMTGGVIVPTIRTPAVGGCGVISRATVLAPSAPVIVSVAEPRLASAQTTRSKASESASVRRFWIVTQGVETVTVAPARFEPLIVTVVVEPAWTLVGETEVTVVVCDTPLARVIDRMLPTAS